MNVLSLCYTSPSQLLGRIQTLHKQHTLAFDLETESHPGVKMSYPLGVTDTQTPLVTLHFILHLF